MLKPPPAFRESMRIARECRYLRRHGWSPPERTLWEECYKDHRAKSRALLARLRAARAKEAALGVNGPRKE